MKLISLSFFFLSLLLQLNAQTAATLKIKNSTSNLTIDKNIYGHFSEHLGRCIYDGYWVDENLNVPKKDRIRLDIVEALKKIHIPNLRWPGGCFADEYHWSDGIGPRNQRPMMVNTNWGGVTEDNSFGTHEFLELCSLLECEPVICGNVGSGSVSEMSKWIEYLNFDGKSPMTDLRKKNGREMPWKVTYWGIGNENWGCGGNMSPEYYANLFNQYATFAKSYPNARLRKIAGGANVGDYNWTEVLMKNIRLRLMWGLTLHYYTRPRSGRDGRGSATSFDEKEYFNTMKNCLRMDELITKHSAIMDKYDSLKRVALVVDEWGIWTDVEPGTNRAFLYQQNSLRDALIAGSTLNIFNNHCDRVRMANLAQTINVLQALILTEKEKMLLTPTYHVFDLYKVHQDAKYLPIELDVSDYVIDDQELPAVNVSASKDSTGVVHMTLVNIDPNKTISVNAALEDISFTTIEGQILTSDKITDINTFEKPDYITIKKFSGVKKDGNNLKIDLPAKSVVMLELN